MRRTCIVSLWLSGAITVATASLGLAGEPKGFKDILGGVEKGKKFHALWPPVAHRSIVGVTVSAKDPDEIMATWESIESPTFREPAVPFNFEIGTVAYAAPDLTQTRTLDVGLGFAELDALASLKKGAGAPAPGGAGGTEKKETGINVGLFSDVKRSASGITVEYYTLGTLMGLPGALTKEGRVFLTPEGRGWIVHRCLRLDGLDYTLTTKSDLGAGLFAKLVSWLPTVNVHYVNSRTVRLLANYPVYIGYKVWRPGADIVGTRGGEEDVHTLGLGSDEIERELEAARAPSR